MAAFENLTTNKTNFHEWGRLRRRILSSVLFVFIREIRGSNAQRRRGVCMCAEVVVYRRSQTAATEKKAPGL